MYTLSFPNSEKDSFVIWDRGNCLLPDNYFYSRKVGSFSEVISIRASRVQEVVTHYLYKQGAEQGSYSKFPLCYHEESKCFATNYVVRDVKELPEGVIQATLSPTKFK